MAMKPRTAVIAGVAGVLAVGAVGTVVYNATSGSADSTGSVEWWVPDWDYEGAVALVAEFEDQNPDLQVELVKTTSDTVANRTAVALDSGNVPDVITESIARVRTYVEKDQLADLSALYGDDMPVEDFAPGLIDSLSVGSATYAVPYRWATNALIYNPELFEAAGIEEPPATFAEFVADAKQLTSGDVVGTAWPMSGEPSDLTLRFLEFALSDGATIEDGAPVLTAQSVQSALDLVGTSVVEGWASPSSFELDNTAIRELFLQGRIAMYPGGVFDVTEALDQDAAIATALLPGPDGAGTAQGVGWAYLVPDASNNKDAAERLVAFLGEPENMAALTVTFPARISASDDPKFQTPERLPYLEQLAEHSIPAVNSPAWTASVQSVHDRIQEVALGRKTVAEATTEILAIADAVGTE